MLSHSRNSPFIKLLIFIVISSCYSFNEKLALFQAADGKVVAEFNFNHVYNYTGQHYHSFPKAIGELSQAFDLFELHLTFTQGRWDYSSLGYSNASAPSGLQIWAWMKDKTQWNGFTNVLAGLFGASINFIDDSVTPNVFLSLRPQYKSNNYNADFKFGRLPREAVCTENLTPFIQLLPCQTKAGIASLFNPYKLFEGNYNSIGIHLWSNCDDKECKKKSLVLTETFTTVFDPIRTHSTKSWSFKSLFERNLTSECAVSSQSEVEINIPQSPSNVWTVKPKTLETKGSRNIAKYKLSSNTLNLDLGVNFPDDNIVRKIPPQVISVNRYKTGHGQERGGLVVDILNSDPKKEISVIYLDVIPFILKLYLHTLTITQNGRLIPNSEVDKIYYQPSINRERPTVLEISIKLPPNSHTTISIDFDKTFLKYTEHPPDANRGFDIGAAIVSFEWQEGIQRIYTEDILIALPTPDFSMPYNVITLTCTLLALFFGSMFNLLVKRVRPVEVKK